MKQALRKRIQLSHLETLAFGLFVSSTECFALFFSVKEGANPTQVALITMLPLVMGALAQFLAPRLVSDQNLNRSVIVFQLLQALGILGLVISWWHGRMNFNLALPSLCLYWASGQVIGPLWLDWAHKAIGPHYFRRYLARKNARSTGWTVLFYLFLACVAQELWHLEARYLFAIGLGARLISILFQVSMNKGEYPKNLRPKGPLPLQSAQKSSSPFSPGPLIAAMVLFKLAVSVSSPFALPYLVQVRHVSTMEYVFLTAIPLLARALTLTHWGKHCFGLRTFFTLQLTSLMIAAIPILWVVAPNIPTLIAFEFYSGVFWAGFELSSVLIIQNMAQAQTRRLLGLHLALMNAVGLIGSLLGAKLLEHSYDYHQLFTLSSLLRFATGVGIILFSCRLLGLASHIKMTKEYLFTLLTIRPTLAFSGRLLFPGPKGEKRWSQSRPIDPQLEHESQGRQDLGPSKAGLDKKETPKEIAS